jgi:hypothetical protein
MGRSRKVGADYGWVGPVAILAAVGGLGFLAWKYLLPSLQTGNSANNAATTDTNTAASTASQTAAAAAGIQPTLNANEMAGIANEVYTLGTQASDSSALGPINDQLTQVNNIADLNGVIAAFGTKQVNASMSAYSSCSLLGYGCQALGLQAFVDVIYGAFDTSGSYKETLNAYFSAQNINYQF